MKNILFGILILSATLAFTPGKGKLSVENGKLSGAVTYKDYYDLSAQADAGSEIYAISEADVKSTPYENLSNVIESFQTNKAYYSLARYNTLDIARTMKLQDDFDYASKFTVKYISEFKKLPSIVKSSTNGNGNYTLNLKPGKYYILVISGSIKSNNILEDKGNIDYKIVNIKSSGQTFMNVNFEKSENTMIMLLTARQREGC